MKNPVTHHIMRFSRKKSKSHKLLTKCGALLFLCHAEHLISIFHGDQDFFLSLTVIAALLPQLRN